MAQGVSEWTRFLTRANQLLRTTTHPAAVQLPVEGRMPSLDGATGWLNSPPLTVADLSGRVVLVNFWTYTCINWLRTLPYVRAWAHKYQDQGLVVLGVHTPEFDVEHDLDNVRRAVTDLRVDYPVAVDNDYAIWSAFDTTTGRRCTSSTPTASSATTTSAKDATSNPSALSSGCLASSASSSASKGSAY